MKRVLGIVLILAGVLVLAAGVGTGSPFSGEKRYLILLQNQMELRPTGGFLGSFATAKINDGKLTDFSVQDIYEPDGRVTEYIEPPEPIQEAFNLGTLRLRDANWDPDFPKTAKTLRWYFRKAGEGEFDGVIATNLLVFQEALRMIGSIKLIDYGEEVTADNLWEKAQLYSQEGFFPGSKQKREFLADLAKGLQLKATDLGIFQKLRILILAVKMASENQIMIYASDENIQKTLGLIGWAGEIDRQSCPVWAAGCIADSLMVVEANLGVNKANCCLERRAKLEIKKTENGLEHKLRLIYKNNSVSSEWGGEYMAWVRVLIPFSAGGEKGFWVRVPVGERREYEIEYFLPIVDLSRPVYLTVQKQSGVDVWPIVIDDRELKVKRDLRLKVEVK